MSKSNVVTLRMPRELRERLHSAAADQGVSMNQLANYLLNRDIAQLERQQSLETRLRGQSVSALQRRAGAILDRVPARSLPAWDDV